ncbi:nifR3 family TIM-barrel protein [Pseudonocardia autotrophica]|uniref:tRNA-dihydrouridine synthase n=3 Tax=Pseudonocardiaceae TaxID=2070 RepID=A0A1Y2MW13_PSEAH|nr:MULTISPECIES: tRNA dihydrouridine synthase DusB [Pseudonocardia]OSY39385.1 putative tRNA-dihydrouridine synthase [Pseudonocardia autotrophica]TDN75377.1 nifR3 family TIM-barrel protein [Pseudonocardia autotrophica]BBF99323.1 tRNA-dihydrouridine synthase [Pseudonocardia autotrophica]GEC28661.1 tRNA-dihydrouridine synthase [Pseudonocardia saturnea]
MTVQYAPARRGRVLPPLRIGPYQVDTPVVLAPMAGITNAGFRRLCREQGAGYYVCEMITARGLVEKNPLTFRMIAFDGDEHPRSMQLYGVDPAAMRRAAEMIVQRDLADHIDMNFGCPVPKVTRRGGGAALPFKRKLFERIVRAAVEGAGDRPVTVKMRIGIDDEHHTHLEAGRIAVDSGAVAVALHARTASQRYSGAADWSAIARLREAVPAHVPVLGNGDIFSAQDALDMVARTGCDGVVVGRGCLGRPWLFGDLEAAFAGRELPAPPNLGQVAATLRRHAVLLCEHMGDHKGIRDVRKHVAWYLKGFPVGSDLRRSLGMVTSIEHLDGLLAELDPDEPFPADADGPRGRQGSPGRVVLPEHWLDDPDDPSVPFGADLEHSGG